MWGRMTMYIGTDIDTNYLKKAKEGVYSEKALKHVSPQRLKEYFIKTEQGYKISE
jgi:two-component system, chemotaxis family, CheB/CheR fusion protein